MPPAIATEKWAALTALITGAALIAKKLITRRSPIENHLFAVASVKEEKSKFENLITRAEFHASLDAIRDRIGASYLALADKIEQQHNQVLSTLDRQGANFEIRLDHLETSVARIDERTKKAP